MGWFDRFTKNLTVWTGSPQALAISLIAIALWGISGPFMGYSDTWQLIINTSTTVITMVLVIVVQATQNRESQALHVKLDEIIESIDAASNRAVGAEEAEREEIEALHQEHLKIKEDSDG